MIGFNTGKTLRFAMDIVDQWIMVVWCHTNIYCEVVLTDFSLDVSNASKIILLHFLAISKLITSC